MNTLIYIYLILYILFPAYKIGMCKSEVVCSDSTIYIDGIYKYGFTILLDSNKTYSDRIITYVDLYNKDIKSRNFMHCSFYFDPLPFMFNIQNNRIIPPGGYITLKLTILLHNMRLINDKYDYINVINSLNQLYLPRGLHPIYNNLEFWFEVKDSSCYIEHVKSQCMIQFCTNDLNQIKLNGGIIYDKNIKK